MPDIIQHYVCARNFMFIYVLVEEICDSHIVKASAKYSQYILDSSLFMNIIVHQMEKYKKVRQYFCFTLQLKKRKNNNDFKCVHGRLCHLCCADHSLIM